MTNTGDALRCVRFPRSLAGIGLGLLFFMGSPQTGFSLPAFARQNNLSCVTCHSSYPRLNPFGKSFKAKGYSLVGPQATAGPWAWQNFYPIAFQGIMGYSFQKNNPTDGDFAVNAVQIFAGGAIAPNLVMYLHHHLVMDDLPGELHEAWIKWFVPRLPVELRIGQFELPLANSPGKTILTHFGYLSYTATLGENPDLLANSKRGVELTWAPVDGLRWATVYYQQEGYRAVFSRLSRSTLTSDIGVFFQYGSATLGDTTEFTDRYSRVGIDFDWLLSALAELYGMAQYGKDTNPHGDGDPGTFWAGFLQLDLHVRPEVVLGVRGETFQNLSAEAGSSEPHLLHEAQGGPLPDHGIWLDLFGQYYLAMNAKLVLEYLRDLTTPADSRGIVGVHYAF